MSILGATRKLKKMKKMRSQSVQLVQYRIGFPPSPLRKCEVGTVRAKLYGAGGSIMLAPVGIARCIICSRVLMCMDMAALILESVYSFYEPHLEGRN